MGVRPRDLWFKTFPPTSRHEARGLRAVVAARGAGVGDFVDAAAGQAALPAALGARCRRAAHVSVPLEVGRKATELAARAWIRFGRGVAPAGGRFVSGIIASSTHRSVWWRI